MSSLQHIRITEVGPRDGLQNESKIISAQDKIAFIDLLSRCGFAEIEVSSFVSPKWVPQLGDAAEVFKHIQRAPGVTYSALIPNEKGLDAALELGQYAPDKFAVFTAASETFSRKNTNATIAETLERFRPVVARAKASGHQGIKASRGEGSLLDASMPHVSMPFPIRAYISCAIACPYEGHIDPKQVREVAAKLLDLGVDEIDLGDTIGAAEPDDIERLYAGLDGLLTPEQTTLHLHDTRGRALECAKRALALGVRSFDSSCSGLGGCPFAPGAPGNVSTQSLVTMLHDSGYMTGVMMEPLIEAAKYISRTLGRTSTT